MRWLLVGLVWLAAPRLVAAQQLVEPSDGLRQVSREVHVTLRDGMALVTTRVELSSESPRPLEARLRWGVPAGAGLAGLEVCSGDECRSGLATEVSGVYEAARTGRRVSSSPIAVASFQRHWRAGWRAHVGAAPVLAGRPFVVTLRYVAPAPVVDGAVTFALPPSGQELNAGRAMVTVDAPGLEAPTIDGRPGPGAASQLSVTTLAARLPTGVARASAWSERCGDDRCSRFRVAAGPVLPTAREVLLLLDASPSARAADPRIRARAIEGLMSVLAPDARVRRVAFARTAEVLDPDPLPPGEVPVDQPLPSLGNQTSFTAAWHAVREFVRTGHDPLVVLVGDGALPSTPATRVALRELTDAGAELSLVTIAADRHVDAHLAAAIQRSLGVSETVLRDDQLNRLARVAAPIVASHVRLGSVDQGPLRAGEERVIETRHLGGGAVPVLTAFGRRLQPQRPRQLWADGFATHMGPDVRSILVVASADQIEAARKGTPAIWGAGFGHRFPTRAPHAISCCIGCGGSYLRGAVSRRALNRVREHLRPAVRACFTRARAGRPTWSARASLQLVIQYGELVSASVPQSSDPALVECLAHVADDYDDFPSAGGSLAAIYVFRSEGQPEPAAEAPGPRLESALRDIGL